MNDIQEIGSTQIQKDGVGARDNSLVGKFAERNDDTEQKEDKFQEENNTFRDLQQQDGVISQRQSDEYFTQQQTHRMQNKFTQELQDSSQNQSVQQTSFSVTKMENECFRYSQELIQASQQFQNNGMKATQIKQLAEKAIINIIPESKNENISRAFRCLRVNDFSSLSQKQSKNKKKSKQKNFVEGQTRQSSLLKETQNSHLQGNYIEQNQHNQASQRSVNTFGPNESLDITNIQRNTTKLYKFDALDKLKDLQDKQSLQNNVPVKTKTIFQKMPSRTAENSPRLKILGSSAEDPNEQKYKLPSMSQFIQKSILPKKQSIINDIYLSKLNKVQNLLSIVGDGNIRLANNLIQHNEDFNIQKSLLKEMEKQKQREKQRKIYISIQHSQDKNEDIQSPQLLEKPTLGNLLQAKALTGTSQSIYQQQQEHFKEQPAITISSPRNSSQNCKASQPQHTAMTDQQFIHSLSSHYHKDQKVLLRSSFQQKEAIQLPLQDNKDISVKQNQQLSNSPVKMFEGHNYMNRTQIFFKKGSGINNSLRGSHKNSIPASTLNSDLNQIVSTVHTNHDIIKNYRGLLKQNLKMNSSQNSQSLVISPSLSRSQSSENYFKEKISNHHYTQINPNVKTTKVVSNEMRGAFHFGLSSQEFEQRRKNLNSTIEKRQRHIFSRESAREQKINQELDNSRFDQNERFILSRDQNQRGRRIKLNQKLVRFDNKDNSLSDGQQRKVSEVIASQLKTNSTNYMLMSLNRILNSKSSHRAVKQQKNGLGYDNGSRSPSRRSLIMIKKNGTIQQKSRHYIPVKSLSQNEDIECEEEDQNQIDQEKQSIRDLGVEEEEERGDDFILQYDEQSKIFSHQDLLQQLSKESSKEMEIRSSMKELEFYRDMRKQQMNDTKHSSPSPNLLEGAEGLQGTKSSKEQGIFYRQMPLINYNFPIESKTRLKDQKSSLKAFTPSLPIRISISKEKKIGMGNNQGSLSSTDLNQTSLTNQNPAVIQSKQKVQLQVISLSKSHRSPRNDQPTDENYENRQNEESPLNSQQRESISNNQHNFSKFSVKHSPKISPTYYKKNNPLRLISPNESPNKAPIAISGSPKMVNTFYQQQPQSTKVPHTFLLQLQLNLPASHHNKQGLKQQQFNSILNKNIEKSSAQNGAVRRSGQWQIKLSGEKKGASNIQQFSLHIADQANNINEVTLERQTLDEREIHSDEKDAAFMKLRNSLKQNSSSKNSGIYRLNEDFLFPKSSSGILADQLRIYGGENSVKSQGKQLQLLLLNTSLAQQLDSSLDPKEKASQSVRQRVNINRALGQIIQNPNFMLGNAASSSSISKKQSRFKMPNAKNSQGIQNNLPITFMGEEQLLGEDDLSSKALNSTTFFKQLENRYQNSQLLENLNHSPQSNIFQTNKFTGQGGGFTIQVGSATHSFAQRGNTGVRSGAGLNSALGLATEEEMIQYRMDPQFNKKSHRGVVQPNENQGYMNRELDRFRPVQLKGQVFSMPISPKNLGEIELKKKRQNIFRVRAIDGAQSSQVVSSKLVHKQFQMNNKQNKAKIVANQSNDNKINLNANMKSQIKSQSLELSI